MLAQAELHQEVLNFPTRKRLFFDFGMTVMLSALAVGSTALVIVISRIVALQVINDDLSTNAVWGAVIMPVAMAYLFVLAGAKRSFDPGLTVRGALWATGRQGLVRGAMVSFVMVVVIHFLGQLLMARAIYGVLHYHEHPAYYCGPLPLLYGLLFALPVGLVSAAYYALYTISPQVVFNLIKRLPVSQN